ncbi:MAG: hypothetical protein ACLU6I_12225 [Clostridium fessum]
MRDDRTGCACYGGIRSVVGHRPSVCYEVCAAHRDEKVLDEVTVTGFSACRV